MKIENKILVTIEFDHAEFEVFREIFKRGYLGYYKDNIPVDNIEVWKLARFIDSIDSQGHHSLIIKRGRQNEYQNYRSS